MAMNKKGLFFWIELVLLVVVIALLVLSFPRSQNGFLANKDYSDMQKLGFSTLQSLDNNGTLETYIDATDFASSDFAALSTSIRSALPSSTYINIEYFDGTSCFNESGTWQGLCGQISRTKDTARAEYTYAKLSSPITFRLYLRRILG